MGTILQMLARMRGRRATLVAYLAWAGACGGGGALTGTGGTGGTATGGTGGGGGSGGGGGVAGATTVVVTVDAGPPTTLATGEAQGPWDIAVDATHVYWSDTKANAVMKVAKQGGATVTLASDQMYVREIAVDSTHVYWTLSAAVMKVPLAGGTPVAVAEQQPSPIDIAADETSVYWSASYASGPNPVPASIMKASRDTGAVTTLAVTGFRAVAIAIDASSVYWLTIGEPYATIEKAPLAGGAATQIAGGIMSSSLASDGSHVYFPTYDPQPANAGSWIKKVPVGGGDTVTLASMMSGDSILVDGAMLTWAAGSAIRRMSKDGGAVTNIPTGDDVINRLVADSTHLYWTTRGGRVMALAKP